MKDLVYISMLELLVLLLIDLSPVIFLLDETVKDLLRVIISKTII